MLFKYYSILKSPSKSGKIGVENCIVMQGLLLALESFALVSGPYVRLFLQGASVKPLVSVSFAYDNCHSNHCKSSLKVRFDYSTPI